MVLTWNSPSKMNERRATKAGKAFVALHWGSAAVVEVDQRGTKACNRRYTLFDTSYLIWNSK